MSGSACPRQTIWTFDRLAAGPVVIIVLHLIQMWLECPMADDRAKEDTHDGGEGNRRGILQRSSSSPLLAFTCAIQFGSEIDNPLDSGI
jgi:hypothetical protein